MHELLRRARVLRCDAADPGLGTVALVLQKYLGATTIA